MYIGGKRAEHVSLILDFILLVRFYNSLLFPFRAFYQAGVKAFKYRTKIDQITFTFTSCLILHRQPTESPVKNILRFTGINGWCRTYATAAEFAGHIFRAALEQRQNAIPSCEPMSTRLSGVFTLRQLAEGRESAFTSRSVLNF